MKQARFISLLLVAAAAMLWSCEKHPAIEPAPSPENDGKGIGQMVMFSGGTTTNRETKADGKTYYMPNAYRFVCRMYYKAQTGSDTFDVEGGTDQTAWLKVDGNVGNSLYWNKDYTPVNPTIHGKGGVDDYGNDYSATAFYWQNRKEHAFLAWTDLSAAKTITGGTTKGTLKFGEDLKYKVYTGEKVDEWFVTGYKMYGSEQNFDSPSAIRDYVEKTFTTDAAIAEFNATQKQLGDQYPGWEERPYQYQYGWSCKHTTHATDDPRYIDTKHREYRWYRYMMFFEKIVYELEEPLESYVRHYIEDKNHNMVLFRLLKDGHIVAEAEVTNEINSDGKYIDSEGNVITNPDLLTYNFYLTDPSGNVRYNEENPQYTFYYLRQEEQRSIEQYDEFPALAFDLTRGTKEHMNQQPDIAQALEIQAPVGATQESNRVNLYFKHMFSQVQVNIKNAADNSVVLDAGDIQKVELLGVSEEGYIFTEIDADGKVRPAAYKEIDFSKYTEEQLKENTYGTAFQMFELPAAETETGYLKSFNAITFGQLQAIRMTWKEKDTEYTHAATFRIPDTEHMNLKSGTKYVWNIEVRRGTLAIIRTEIIDWEYPDDEAHNGHTSGTIIND